MSQLGRHLRPLITASTAFGERLSNWTTRLARLFRRGDTGEDLEISITRLPEWSLLTVRGRVNAGTSACFRRSLRETFNFSARPVVIDLRDAEFAEAGAVRELAVSWEEAVRRGMAVEVVVNVASRPVSVD